MHTRAIRRIIVKKLFGQFNYDLLSPEGAMDSDRLLVLYGDNGTGKTTILRALFHLLSPESGQGHKTALASIPVERLEVQFTTGDKVWIERKVGTLTGTYALGIRFSRKSEQTCDFVTESDGSITPSANTAKFLRSLAKLELAFYLLSDDRTVRFAGTDRHLSQHPHAFDDEADQLLAMDLPPSILRRRLGANPEERAQRLLVQSMKRAERWIQSQAVRGSSQGESGVNALYGEILSRIAAIPVSSKEPAENYFNGLAERMNTLETRSKTYATYGLLPEFHGKEILRIVRSSPATHSTLLSSVLAPYLESVEKKLDAMAALQRQIDALVVQVNSFYTGKRLTYEIHEGFRITTDSSANLSPHQLSSGERHLLLLFCNTIQALDKQSIFMIDEPELSLNIKWQRRLVPALRECVGHGPVQYIFATHSFELLAQCSRNALRLLDAKEGADAAKEDD